MKKTLLALLVGMLALTGKAQYSYLSAPGVAVFYPANYDASAHAPSPIFEQELYPIGEVPADWKIRPVYSQTEKEQVVTLHVGEDVDLYGGGEVWGSLRRNGKTIEFWNMDNPYYSVDNGTHLYQSHPWIMGLRPDGSAFGIIADNTWRGKMTSDKDVVFTSLGPAFRVVVIEKESPKALMQALVALTGNMELPPMWALGYQQCRFSYYPDTRVKEIADTLRYHQIPSDVIWMDIHYMDKFKIFTFDPKGFSNPKELNDYLHAKNFKSVYMIDPGIKVEKGFWLDDEGTAKDYWVRKANGEHYIGKVWPGPCHFPDFTRPEVRRWWSTLYVPFMAQGVDGVWNDMNEPAIGDGPEVSMPKDNIHRGGEGMAEGPHLRFHNVYGFNMVRASRDGLLLANPNKRPFVLSRSNFLGGHRYAATWTGDNKSSWEQFEASVPMSLTLGLSGQPFNGPDIGGFVGSTNAHLLAHWTALGVYYPFVRNHTTENSVAQEPWAFDKQTLDICRTAINRRYRLMPYIYTLFEEASVNGMPVMRPLFMLDAKNPAFRTEEKAFMLGNDLYIIPRWAPEVALPEGNWNILKLEDQDDGVQPYLAQRPGSIIPMANLYQNTTELRTDSLTLLVNPDAEGKAVGTLYEDARDGFEYRDGHFARYELKAETFNKKLNVTIRKIEGKDEAKPRVLRVGYVTDQKITYSPWTAGETVSMKVVKDKTDMLVLKGLKFVEPEKNE